MISASKTTFSHYNLKILRPKVTKNVKDLLKKFCEFPPRTDLAMTKGKVAAQCAHAAVNCYKKSLVQYPDYVRSWEMFGETKVALKIDSVEALRELQLKAEAKELAVAVIRDAGK